MDLNRMNSARAVYEEYEKLEKERNQSQQIFQHDGPYMSEMPLLSQEQISLLQWLSEQSKPLSMLQIAQENAPGFTRERLANLETEAHLVERLLGTENGQLIGRYQISDKGRAVLLKIEQELRQAAEEKERRAQDRELAEAQTSIARSQNRILIVQTIITLVSFVAGLLAEHFVGLIDTVLSLFR